MTTGEKLGAVAVLVVGGGLVVAASQVVWTFLFKSPPFTVPTSLAWLGLLGLAVWGAKRSERRGHDIHDETLWRWIIIIAFAGGLALSLAVRDYYLIPTFRPDYQEPFSDDDYVDEGCQDWGSRTC